MREIKHRIANISSTGQIIKAMDTIASTRLHKARAQLDGVRPMYRELKRQAELIARHPAAAEHPFFQEREVRYSLYLVLTSDRGFAGAYNSNVLKKAMAHMNEGRREKILVVGSKGYEYFRRRKKNIIRHVTDVADSRVYYGTQSLAEWMAELYLSGEADEVFLVSTHFENILSNVPQIERLLPVPAISAEDDDQFPVTFEQDPDTIINRTIPLYLHMSLFHAFSESHTSEQASRMVTMDAADKNAEELIEDLTVLYNRERQAAITQELSEIVAGANI